MMFRVILIFWIFIFFLGVLSAQKEDFQWQLGYDNGIDDIQGTQLDFRFDPVAITPRMGGATDLSDSNTAISDAEGKLLFYTNGSRIYDRRHRVMQNGDTLSPTPIGLDYLDSKFDGQRVKQNVIILPWPGRDSLYFLLHHYIYYDTDLPGLAADTLLYSVVDMRKNNGYGAVVQKNKPVFFDPEMLSGRITACRHANGRDWWILVRRKHEHGYHRFLMDSSGLDYQGIQNIGPWVSDVGIGQAAFSQDGAMYVYMDYAEVGGPITIQLYRFDRCTGTLRDPVHLEYQPEADFSGRGLAFSPNNRYLYASSSHFIFQFDLHANDIQESMKLVAEIDGYDCPETTSPLIFNYLQLAPDGRIYISGGGSHCHLSYINYPDRHGTACEVVQHGVKLASWNYKTLPDFPHFRLGPLHSSACDTLGIERPPVARFREEPKDSTDPFTLRFTDLSWYQPFEWQWSFGDGQTDTVQHPDHSYADTGSYTVCLTVTNEDGVDTHCDTIRISEQVTDISGPVRHKTELRVYPVPARHQLQIEGLQTGETVYIYDLYGQLMDRFTPRQERMEYDTGALPPGTYLIRTADSKTAKFILIR